MDVLGEANAATLIGLLGGLVLGLAARVGRFCTLGAIEDFLYSTDNRRLRMWGIAVGVAVIFTQASISFGYFAATETAYLSRAWRPFATILGGLLFGYGMALSGNCAYGALARLGGGDIRSFVIVIVLGLSAYFTMSGPLAQFRVWLFPVEIDPTNPQGFGALFTTVLPLQPTTIGLVLGTSIVLISIASKQLLNSPRHIFWGCAVGLSIVSGWIGTNWIVSTGFGTETLESHSFAAPIGDTIIYAMTASGSTLSFSVGSVVGVVIGAFIGSILKGQFKWEACDDPRELGRQIFGAMLMGVGAVLAVGCSVGQGLSAFSVLAYSAPVAFIAIFIGAAIGLKQLITGFETIG